MSSFVWKRMEVFTLKLKSQKFIVINHILKQCVVRILKYRFSVATGLLITSVHTHMTP